MFNVVFTEVIHYIITKVVLVCLRELTLCKAIIIEKIDNRLHPSTSVLDRAKLAVTGISIFGYS